MSVFEASFADFKIVKTRGVAQFVFEVDLRVADAALRVLGGVPQPEAEQRVGIARLKPERAAAAPEPAPEPPAKAPRERMAWRHMSAAQQSGLLCNDKEFQAFADASDAAAAASWVRTECGVGSRADLDHDYSAAVKWDAVVRRFREWQRQQQTEARYVRR